MEPKKIPIKGLVGKDEEGRIGWPMPEPQEPYEAYDEHADIVNGNFTQDPFELKANERDHTPNHTRAPKQGKPRYGHFTGRDLGEEIGL